MPKLQFKYGGVIIKSDDGSIVPEDEWILFRVSDKCLMKTLIHYMGECEHQGCSNEFRDKFEELIIRIKEWQEKNPDRVKVPD